MHLAKLLWKHTGSPRLALSKGYGYQITARTAWCRRETVHVPVNIGTSANTHTMKVPNLLVQHQPEQSAWDRRGAFLLSFVLMFSFPGTAPA